MPDTAPPRAASWRLAAGWARAVVVHFNRDEGPVYAAAISFYALVSLVPLAVLLVALGGQVMARLGAAGADSQEMLMDDVVGAIQQVLPFVEDAPLRALVDRLVQDRGNLGLAGLLGLMFAASQVVNAIRRAVKRPLGEQPMETVLAAPNTFLHRVLGMLATVWQRAKTFAWLAIMGMFIGAFRLVAMTVQGWMGAGTLDLQDFVEHGFLRFLLGHAGGVALTFLGFNAVLIHVARRVTTWRARVAGGLLFACLQVMAEVAFEIYVTRYASLGVQYGSLASLVALATWIFYTSCVFLLCVQVVALGSNPARVDLANTASGEE